MERRDFVTSAIAMAGVALTGAEVPGDGVVFSGVLSIAEVRDADGAAVGVVQNYFEHALIPALNRMGMAPVGAFKLDIGPETPTYYLLIPASSVEALATVDLQAY